MPEGKQGPTNQTEGSGAAQPTQSGAARRLADTQSSDSPPPLASEVTQISTSQYVFRATELLQGPRTVAIERGDTLFLGRYDPTMRPAPDATSLEVVIAVAIMPREAGNIKFTGKEFLITGSNNKPIVVQNIDDDPPTYAFLRAKERAVLDIPPAQKVYIRCSNEGEYLQLEVDETSTDDIGKLRVSIVPSAEIEEQYFAERKRVQESQNVLTIRDTTIHPVESIQTETAGHRLDMSTSAGYLKSIKYPDGENEDTFVFGEVVLGGTTYTLAGVIDEAGSAEAGSLAAQLVKERLLKVIEEVFAEGEKNDPGEIMQIALARLHAQILSENIPNHPSYCTFCGGLISSQNAYIATVGDATPYWRNALGQDEVLPGYMPDHSAGSRLNMINRAIGMGRLTPADVHIYQFEHLHPDTAFTFTSDSLDEITPYINIANEVLNKPMLVTSYDALAEIAKKGENFDNLDSEDRALLVALKFPESSWNAVRIILLADESILPKSQKLLVLAGLELVQDNITAVIVTPK